MEFTNPSGGTAGGTENTAENTAAQEMAAQDAVIAARNAKDRGRRKSVAVALAHADDEYDSDEEDLDEDVDGRIAAGIGKDAPSCEESVESESVAVAISAEAAALAASHGISAIRAERFLLASGAKAEERVVEALAWRASNDADAVTTSLDALPLTRLHEFAEAESSDFLARFPYYVYGRDLDGDPVVYAMLSPPSCATDCDVEAMRRGRLIQCELSLRVQREVNAGLGARRHTVVIDMKQLGLGHVRPKVVSVSKTIVEPDFYYPWICKQILCVNTPTLASAALRMALTLIPARIMRERPMINQKLGRWIDPRQVPEAYGGTAMEPMVLGGVVFPPLVVS
jgi:hypothetical protein